MNSSFTRIAHHCRTLQWRQLGIISHFCCRISHRYSLCTCATSTTLHSYRAFPGYGRVPCGTGKAKPCYHPRQLSHPVAFEQVTFFRNLHYSVLVPTFRPSSVLETQKTLPTKLHVAFRRQYASEPEENKNGLPHHETVIERLQRVEDSLRYHGYSTVRIGFALSIMLGVAIYVFREAIRENVAEEVSQVASRSLEDRLVADKAEEFSKGLLNALLKDEPMHQLASQFVVEVFQRSETKQAMNALVMDVLQDPNTKAQLTATVKQVIVAALNDEDTQAYIRSVLRIILSDKETMQAVINLLGYVFREAEVKELTAIFFRDVLKSKVVVEQATQLGKRVTNSIISDPGLQEKTGDSLWAAVMYSVTPRWFSGSSSPSDEDKEDAGVKQDEKMAADTSELDADKESVLGG